MQGNLIPYWDTTDLGKAALQLANPGFTAFLRTNANGTISALNAADFRTAIGVDPTYYNRSNILGTVSQSGGVPTGALLGSGSNANGDFIRWADGTMICRFSGTFNVIMDSRANRFGSTSGSMFFADITITMPSSFSSAPIATITKLSNAGGVADIISTAVGSITVRVWDYLNITSIGIAGIIIGRWY